MNKGILILLCTALLALPVAGFSAEHGMDHGSMSGMDHGGMKMDESVVMLPMQTVDGVSATVHLKDVKTAMAKMGMKHTHHFMVILEDDSNGEAIVPLAIAVKITDPSGKESEPVALMAMKGHAGADVILAVPGAYIFKVAAKLPGDKKVQYEFKQVLK